MITENFVKPQNNTRPKKHETGRKNGLRVCFVCTGNTCRSPMAAALLNDMGRVPEICSMCDMERLINSEKIHATSAGLFANGSPISENAVKALELSDVRSLPDNDYKSHISRSVTASVMEESDIIVGISGRHTMHPITMFPQYASKIISMPCDIPDPFGGDVDEYTQCLEQIKACIKELFFSHER